MARVVALETGKSLREAMGETSGAISLGRFFAGEGQRLYGRTTTSGVADRYAMTVRQPCGVAALITAANTPIANVAWKVLPDFIQVDIHIVAPYDRKNDLVDNYTHCLVFVFFYDLLDS